MKILSSVIKRNTKLFFKDKAMFFTSLITPIILLVLYTTFLAKVYRESFMASVPKGFEFPEKLIDGCVGAQLLSSLLAVSCVTVAFCSNMLIVNDKLTGARSDFTIAPIKRSTLALGYYIASFISTLIISFIALGAGLLYLGKIGWYYTASDIVLIVLDVILITMFGTALSSCVNFFLSTQGQISAVGTIMSAGYGFICGAYMPISQYGSGLQKILSFLPGTYCTSLIRNHSMAGVFREMEKQNFPDQQIEGIKKSIDCSIEFFGNKVSISAMYIVLAVSILIAVGLYVLFNVLKKTDKK